VSSRDKEISRRDGLPERVSETMCKEVRMMERELRFREKRKKLGAGGAKESYFARDREEGEGWRRDVGKKLRLA